MTIEVQKHRAQILQIFGFAFMAPFGKLVLKFFELESITFNLHLLLATIVSLVLLYLGIIVLSRSLEVTEGRK